MPVFQLSIASCFSFMQIETSNTFRHWCLLQDNALDILKILKKLPISLETLQKTHVGMSVNNVRKQTKNDEVASTAKQLIKSWKKLVPGIFDNFINGNCN